MMLSSSERAVLSAMQLRGLEGEQIRQQTGLSLRTISRARDRLTADGLIQRGVRIQPTAMGLHNRFVWCSLSAFGLCSESEIIKFLRNAPQVSWIDTHVGDYDLFFTVNGHTLESINRFVESLNPTLGNVFQRMEVIEVQSWTIFRRKLLFDDLRNTTNYRHIDSVTLRGYKPNQVDILDLKILEKLSYAPHLKSLRLGEELETAPRTIRDRCRRLREKEILLGSYYALNWDKAGLGAGTYLIEVPNLDEATLKNMHIFSAEHPNIWAYGVYSPSSSYQFCLGVEGSSYSEIHALKAQIIRGFSPKRIDYTIHRGTAKCTVDATYYHKNYLD